MEDHTVINCEERPLQQRPLYKFSELGRILHLESRTIKRWFEGYETTRNGMKIVYPAWMNQPQGGLLSFTDLIELWFVQQFQLHRVPLSKIRATYRAEAKRLECPHPFLKKTLWLVVGQTILAVDKAGDPEARIVFDPINSQLYLDQIALEVGEKIDFDDQDFARRWFPLGRSRPISVDPAVGYGEPVINGRRLRTRDVFQLWQAEEQNEAVVCDAFGINPEQLKAAIEWESISKN